MTKTEAADVGVDFPRPGETNEPRETELEVWDPFRMVYPIAEFPHAPFGGLLDDALKKKD